MFTLNNTRQPAVQCYTRLTYDGVSRTKTVSVDLIEVFIVAALLLRMLDHVERTCQSINQSIRHSAIMVWSRPIGLANKIYVKSK